MSPDVVPVQAFPQHHGLAWPKPLRLHPILEFRVVHPLEHGLGAGLAASSGSGAVEGGEEAARRGAEEGGAPAPPEERHDLRLRRRRHGELSGW